ncbi:hypothetical protein DFH28DRAFT_1078578 [Melampsora americana]|nr:hypothetical protein DFH28DRAFT_1078578 [Melampsora americana]
MNPNNQPSQTGNASGGNQSHSTFEPLPVSPSGSLFFEHEADPGYLPNLSTSSTPNRPSIYHYPRTCDLNFCYTEVVHASILIEQCVLRLNVICEPLLEQLVLPLTQLQLDYENFELDMYNGKIDMTTQAGYANSYARLSVMCEFTARMEFALSSLSFNFSGLSQWIQDRLTPVLVQVWVAANEDNLPQNLEYRHQIISLLEFTSFLSQSMESLTKNFKMYEKIFNKIMKNFNVILSPDILPGGSGARLNEGQILKWANQCIMIFKPIFDGVSVVANIPSCTMGTANSTTTRRRVTIRKIKIFINQDVSSEKFCA